MCSSRKLPEALIFHIMYGSFKIKYQSEFFYFILVAIIVTELINGNKVLQQTMDFFLLMNAVK